MKTFPLLSFVFFIFLSLVQTDFVEANPNPVIRGIFERDAGECEHTGENTLDDERNKELEPPIMPTICPDRSLTIPCNCTLEGFDRGMYLICIGSKANQAMVENVLSQVRRVNGIPEDRGIEIASFNLEQTALTQFDMAPFYGSHLEFLGFLENEFLTKLVTSGNPKDHGAIRVDHVSFSNSPLNRDGFGDVFKYFSNEMNRLDASYVFMDGQNPGAGEGEYLPGLSAQTNIRTLQLQLNGLTRLTAESWNFTGLHSLQDINLYSNDINEIGEDVFNFDVTVLEIELRLNKLNESSFHPNSGIARPGRETHIDLRLNEITTLPALIFEPFFDAHPGNSVDLLRNPLICDQRLSWLKSRRDELQSRVTDADCTNDPGHDVFDSNLIP